MIKHQLLADINDAISKAGFKPTDTVISISDNNQFGDYTSNIPLQLAKQNPEKSYQSSHDIANKIIEEFGHPSYLERIDVAGPGFLNFFIKAEFLAKDLYEILEQGSNFGNTNLHKNQKARVEFISANPTGPLHIGNARGGPLGDVIGNILASTGYEVFREYIHNDIGGQVKQLGATIIAKIGGSKANPAEKLAYEGAYIDDLARSVEKMMNEILGDQKATLDSAQIEEIAGKIGVELLLKEIMEDVEAMGIRFDQVFYESELQKNAQAVIDELDKKGVIKEQEGALWFAPNDEFLKDRETVVKKSNGEYTYFTSDIVYHKHKFESGTDLIIDVFGSNHHGHVPRLQAAAAAFGFDPEKLKVVLYQYVRVKRGTDIVKMSKRAGNFITAREVLDEVGKDAFRFMLLKNSSQTHVDFDIDLVKEKSNQNPVYYVQYAHARMANILTKVEKFNESRDGLEEEAELELIKHLMEFPDLIQGVSESLEVHKLADYSIKLADLFHKFYEKCPVITAPDQIRDSRLTLVKASKMVLSNCLTMLGISAPERM